MSKDINQLLFEYPHLSQTLYDVCVGEIICDAINLNQISDKVFDLIIHHHNGCTHILDSIDAMLQEMTWMAREHSSGAVSIHTVLVKSNVYDKLLLIHGLQNSGVKTIKFGRNTNIFKDIRLDATDTDILGLCTSKFRPVQYRQLLYFGNVVE